MTRGLSIGIFIGIFATVLLIVFAQQVVAPVAEYAARPGGPAVVVEQWLAAAKRADLDTMMAHSSREKREQIARDRAIITRLVAIEPMLAVIPTAGTGTGAGDADTTRPTAAPTFDFEFTVTTDRTQIYDEGEQTAVVFATLTRNDQSITRRFELVKDETDGAWKIRSWSNESAEIGGGASS